MGRKDRRRPIEVTRDFRERLARDLADRGFAARRQASVFVRRTGKLTEGVHLSSSHHNTPGDVTCWIDLSIEDKEIAARAPGWRAGGGLGSPAFKQDHDWNIADFENADRLLDHILASLSFFALAADPGEILRQVCTRYVGGFVDPSVVAPYLAVRLGGDAVVTYARSLLAGRPELWPGFVGQRDGAIAASRARPGHGTELAMAIATYASDAAVDVPADVVRAQELVAANLRCALGLQLRAWGEPEAAALLRRLDDDRVTRLRETQTLAGMTVDDPISAGMALRAATGEDRAPRRSTPSPRLFQYHVLHDPFTAA